MTIYASVSNDLTGWADEATLDNLTDEEIINMIEDDLTSFLNGATWQIDRGV